MPRHGREMCCCITRIVRPVTYFRPKTIRVTLAPIGPIGDALGGIVNTDSRDCACPALFESPAVVDFSLLDSSLDVRNDF